MQKNQIFEVESDFCPGAAGIRAAGAGIGTQVIHGREQAFISSLYPPGQMINRNIGPQYPINMVGDGSIGFAPGTL